MAKAPTTVGLFDAQADPVVRRIGLAEIRTALARGYADFADTPTQLMFLGLIYPLIGLLAATAASGGELLPLLYPIVAGLSLMGPVAAVGIYELSRRRERGHVVSWVNAFDVLRSPSIGSIAALGLLLCVIFVAWLFAAQAVYRMTMGDELPASIGGFPSSGLQHPRGVEPHPLGQRGRLPFRGRGADPHRRVLPLASRPGCRSPRRNPDVDQGRSHESGHDGRVGPDRGGRLVHRLPASLCRARRRHAGARALDVASLSAGGGALKRVSPAVGMWKKAHADAPSARACPSVMAHRISSAGRRSSAAAWARLVQDNRPIRSSQPSR